MGSCVWCCWAGLLCCHGTVLCRGGGALGNSGARMHAEGLNRVGRIVYGCVYCAHRVHSAEQVFGDTDGETDGLCCRCGRPGLLRAQEGQSKRFEDRKCVGSGGVCGKQRVRTASTLHLIIGHCNCLLLGCLWAQHLCYFRQGSTWTNTAPTRFNVGLLVEAGDGGGGALVPGSGSWTLFLFFRRCGGRQHRGEGAGGWHSAVNFRDDARRRDVLLGYAPHALPITCGRRAAVEGREGSGRLRRKVV